MATLIRLVPLVLGAMASAAPAALTERDLAAAVAHPPAGARLPAGLSFTNGRGAAITFGQVAGGRPLVLLFADYTCRHICGPGAALTAAALHDTGLVPGRDYAFAVLGLDARDGVSDARVFAARLAPPAVARSAVLLTGTPAAVATAERALGYRAVYDPASDQWAHDASAYVFARDGHLAAVLPELAVRGPVLRAALAGAPAAESFGDKVAHLCWGFASAHGRFGAAVAAGLQALALLTLAGLGLFAWRRRPI